MIACLLLIVSAWAQQSSPPPELGEWNEVVDQPRTYESIISRSRDKVSEAVFYALEDLKIFETDFGGITWGVRAGRKIFDNRDFGSTWSMIDHFRVSARLPIYEWSLGTGAGGAIGFSFGLRGEIDFMNIRQVSSTDYPFQPDIEAERVAIEASPWLRETENFDSEKSVQWIPSADEKTETLVDAPKDLRDRSKFEKIWNIALFPFRIPFKAQDIQKLTDHEVISYAGTGAVELGPTVGWSLEPASLADVATGKVGFTTFLSGTFRISILKESDQKVQVKVSRVEAKGFNWGASSTAQVPLNGIFALKSWDGLRVVPFSLTSRWQVAQGFDVGYRYDLTRSHAREAYEDAVIGSFALSDELSQSAESGVQKVFTRDYEKNGRAQSRELKVSIIYRDRERVSLDQVEMTIKTAEGISHIFQSIVTHSKDWRGIWGGYEKMNYRFMVQLDKDAYKNDPKCEKCLQLQAEGEISDSRTKEKELMQYILSVEDSVGKFGIFPRPSRMNGLRLMDNMAFAESRSDSVSLPLEHLGRSRFFFKLVLDQPLLRKIASTPEDQKWAILEKAFGVSPGAWASGLSRIVWRLVHAPMTLLNIPLYVTNIHMRSGSSLYHAKRIKDQWDVLESYTEGREFSEAFGRMLFDRVYSYELVHLLRASLDGEKVPYFATGYSAYFGKVVSDGETALAFQDIASEKQRAIDFDRTGPRPPNSEKEEVVDGLSFEALEGGAIRVEFSLHQIPKAMAFQSFKKKLFRNEKRADILLTNMALLKTGKNSILIRPDQKDHPLYPLLSTLVSGRTHLFRAALNLDGIKWGPVTPAELYVPKKFQTNE